MKKEKIALMSLSLLAILLVTLFCSTNQVKGNQVVNEQSTIIYESPSDKIVKYTTIKFDINEEFKTNEEADLYIENCNLTNECELTKEEKYTDWVSNGIEKVAGISGLTEEERDKKVENYKSEIEKTNTELEKYVLISENTSDSENAFKEEILTEEEKIIFEDEETAKLYIAELEKSNTEDIRYEVEGPIKEKEFVKTEYSNFEQTFETKEERDNFIKELEKQGYVINEDELKISEEETITEKIIETDNIIIKSSSKLDKNSSYSVKGNYLMLKQASGNVAVWTLEELTEGQKASFKSNWLNGNYDGSVNNKYNFYFIFGEGTHDLSYIGNQWDKYIISVSQDVINLNCNSSNISHLNYGTFEKETKTIEEKTTKYKISGVKSIDIYKDIYEVLYKKYVKTYETVITYGALISKELFIREKYYIVSGYCEEIKEEYIEKPKTYKREKSKTLTNKREFIPPYTGSNKDNTNFLLDLLIISAFAIYFPIRKELENLN